MSDTDAAPLTLDEGIEMSLKTAPLDTWSNDDVTMWEYVGHPTSSGAAWYRVRTTSAWSAARNGGCGRKTDHARCAFPVGYDPNTRTQSREHERTL